MTDAETTAKVYACPECSKEFDKPGPMVFHRIAVHGYKAKGKSKAGSSRTKTGGGPPARSMPLEAEVAAVVEAAVGNLRGVGGLLKLSVAPHTGTAIMGVEVPAGTEGAFQIPGALGEDAKRWWLVKSRAVMAGPVVFEQAKRDPRIFQILRSFNRAFELGAGVEVLAGVAAAAAVDAGVPPEFGVMLGRIPLQPIPAIIPDVLEWVELERVEEARLAGGSAPREAGSNGAQPGAKSGAKSGAKVTVVEGGVEAT